MSGLPPPPQPVSTRRPLELVGGGRGELAAWEVVTFLKDGFRLLEICPSCLSFGVSGRAPFQAERAWLCAGNYKFSLTPIYFPHPSLCVKRREATQDPAVQDNEPWGWNIRLLQGRPRLGYEAAVCGEKRSSAQFDRMWDKEKKLGFGQRSGYHLLLS